jgi:hypothetical protein
MTSKRTIIIGLLALTALVLAGCGAEGPQGPVGPQGDQGPPGEAGATTCTECHDATTTILGIIRTRNPQQLRRLSRWRGLHSNDRRWSRLGHG